MRHAWGGEGRRCCVGLAMLCMAVSWGGWCQQPQQLGLAWCTWQLGRPPAAPLLFVSGLLAHSSFSCGWGQVTARLTTNRLRPCPAEQQWGRASCSEGALRAACMSSWQLCVTWEGAGEGVWPEWQRVPEQRMMQQMAGLVDLVADG